jgi:alanine racemase
MRLCWPEVRLTGRPTGLAATVRSSATRRAASPQRYTPRVNRRRFLGATTLAAASTLLPRGLEAAAQRPSDYPTDSLDPWIEVHAPNLAHNTREVARAAGKRPILAVIKNNGYGLGAHSVARLLEPLPEVHGFAVVKLDEAVLLRDRGIKKPVLLMGPFTTAELATLTAKDIMPMVYTPVGAELERAAAGLTRPLDIHVCVDTGLGRVGVPYTEAAPLIRDLAGRKNVRIAGVMMTFTEDQAFDQEMLKRFEALTGELSAGGVPIGRRHAASSYTFFQHDNAWLDMVRTGMVLYGVYPDLKFRKDTRLDLRPAVALRARVIYVKKMAAGTSAGYERAYMAKQDTWIATLPVGHTDGWPRVAVKGARVRINNRLYPVIASVSASHTIVEIGAEQTVKIGDVATMLDWTNGSRPEDVSAACGASVYDLLMHLNSVIPRYVMTESDK